MYTVTEFFEKFNEITENKYDYIRLNKLELDKDEKIVTLNFLTPSEKYSICHDDDFEKIFGICRQIIPQTFDLKIKFNKTFLDKDVIVGYLKSYFIEKFKALVGQYDENNIQVNIKENNVAIKIPTVSYVCEFCKKAKVDEKLQKHLDSLICANIKIEFVSSGNIDTSAIIEQEYETLLVDTGIVETSEQRPLAGKGVAKSAKCISKFNEPASEICVCGVISNFQKRIAKKNSRIYYTFDVDDSTGIMSCAYFSRGTNKGALDCVTDGETVILSGKFVEDTYKKGNKLIADKISYCKVDYELMREKKEAIAIAYKKKNIAYPTPYFDTSPISLFDIFNDEKCEALKKYKFVVFDLETTGLDDDCEIVEIGAVKIENGEIVSSYTTLVDPRISIPTRASEINNIFDKDVKDAPYIEDCLQDFLDYCQDSYLVAHNAAFDTGYIKRACKKFNLEFFNRTLDTVSLARKAYPEFSSFKLGALCKKLNIVNNTAHRGLSDAEATAKLFIKIANKLRLDTI